MTVHKSEAGIAEYPAVHTITNPASVALLIVDMQTIFIDEGKSLASESGRGIIKNIARLIAVVRKQGGTIAWTRHTWSDAGPDATPNWFNAIVGAPAVAGLKLMRPGNHEHQISQAFEVIPTDIVVDKYRPSAFLPEKTGLHDALQMRGLDTVIVTGVLTNYCCQSTARDAMMLDYRVFFVPDATACASEEIQKATLDDLNNMGFFDLRSTDEVVSVLTA